MEVKNNFGKAILGIPVRISGSGNEFIVSHISVAFEFDGGLQREERFAYPLLALREALLNAVAHRDYTNPSDIQIKIFDDRITFFSSGWFYGRLSVPYPH